MDKIITRSSSEEWWDSANCIGVDQELFYSSDKKLINRGEMFCRKCVVKDECLNHAITHNERFGTWGGVSEKDRNSARRARESAMCAESRAQSKNQASVIKKI